MELKKYITYEEPLEGKSFTINQLHEVYRDLVSKEEYPDFECWFTDMLKVIEIRLSSFYQNIYTEKHLHSLKQDQRLHMNILTLMQHLVFT